MVKLLRRRHRHGIAMWFFSEHDEQGLEGAKIPFPLRKMWVLA